MVTLSVTSSVTTEDGPDLSLASEFEAESCVVATVTLEPNLTRKVSLLPEPGKPVLLAVQAIGVSGPAKVSILFNPPEREDTQAAASRPADPQVQEAAEGNAAPQDASVEKWIEVKGALLISGGDVLEGLGTPRYLSIKNTGTEPAKVRVFSALDLP
ncbi:hypothetical protein [Streptomyces bobili]